MGPIASAPLEIGQRTKTPVTITISIGGVPVPLAGCHVWFTMKKHADDLDADAIIAREIIAHVDPVNGITGFTTTVEETDNDAGDYVCDVAWDNAGETLLQKVPPFPAKLVPDVTDDATRA